MDGRHVAAVGAVVAIAAVTATASVLVGVGPAAALFDGEEERPPALLDFDATDAQCTDRFVGNSSTSMAGGGPNTELTYARNVSLADTSHAVGDASLERLNESSYVLSVSFEDTDAEAEDCEAFARYEADMRIPAGEDRWTLIVEHDGERVTTLWGETNSSMVGGSASAGSSVSAGGSEAA